MTPALLLLAVLLSDSPPSLCPPVSDVPAAGSCHFGPNGEPDPTCTPGDTNVEDIETLCATTTKGRRCTPDAALKTAIFAAYGLVWKPGKKGAPPTYEVDHRLSLTVGGSDAIKNLWPQAASPTPGFHEKDRVEDAMHLVLCDGKKPRTPAVLSLEAARAILLDTWVQYYNTLPKKGAKKKPAPPPVDPD